MEPLYKVSKVEGFGFAFKYSQGKTVKFIHLDIKLLSKLPQLSKRKSFTSQLPSKNQLTSRPHSFDFSSTMHKNEDKNKVI